jgi:hypothetical protein
MSEDAGDGTVAPAGPGILDAPPSLRGMDCVVCNQTGGVYRLVDGDVAAVCEQCVAEYLPPDLDNATCLYCDSPADYDLVEYTGPVVEAGNEDEADYEMMTEGVVCQRHLDNLRGEGT